MYLREWCSTFQIHREDTGTCSCARHRRTWLRFHTCLSHSSLGLPRKRCQCIRICKQMVNNKHVMHCLDTKGQRKWWNTKNNPCLSKTEMFQNVLCTQCLSKHMLRHLSMLTLSSLPPWVIRRHCREICSLSCLGFNCLRAFIELLWRWYRFVFMSSEKVEAEHVLDKKFK